jgi:phosphate-selective porin OprO and OprP
LPELSGHIFIGRTKEGFSMNKVMNGYAGWTMERQMALDVIPILADGIKLLGFLPKTHLFWNVGVFNDFLSHKQTFSTFSSQFITRFGWLPIYNPKKKTILHVGMNYRYGIVKDGQIQVRSRPEANPAPYFIDTKKFSSDHSNQLGYEIYFSSGSLMMGSEYYFHNFTSPENDNPTFQGGEIGASYVLTGESRAYNTVSGIYAFVPVKKSIFAGGTGAIEFVIRYSILNLNGGKIRGGKFWRITPMVNWYLSNHVRLEFVYGYGVLDRFNLQGTTQFFQSRIHFQLL